MQKQEAQKPLERWTYSSLQSKEMRGAKHEGGEGDMAVMKS